MVNSGIVLGHIVSKKGIEIDKAKVELISKLSSPKTVQEMWSISGQSGSTAALQKNFQKFSNLCVTF